MGAPYNSNGNFVVFAHVLDSQFTITKERGASTKGSSILAVYESIHPPWERDLAWKVNCAQVLQTIGRAHGVPLPGNRLSEMIALPVIESEDLWRQVRPVEESTETPASAIPVPFASYEQFIVAYNEIRRELHITQGMIHATPTYKNALKTSIDNILRAPGVLQANGHWVDLREYFPISQQLRTAIPARLREIKHDFWQDEVLRELFGKIKVA